MVKRIRMLSPFVRAIPRCVLCLIPAAFALRCAGGERGATPVRSALQLRGLAFCAPTLRTTVSKLGAFKNQYELSRGRACTRPSSAHTLSMSGEGLLDRKRTSIAIVGGGLAGLAVAYNLLDLTRSPGSADISVTILDTDAVGEGGASGAMAGLLHPLTPRGKKLWMVRRTRNTARAPARSRILTAQRGGAIAGRRGHGGKPAPPRHRQAYTIVKP